MQTDRRTLVKRVFPERRLPGSLKQTGVCEGAAGRSRELYTPQPPRQAAAGFSSPLSSARSLVSILEKTP